MESDLITVHGLCSLLFLTQKKAAFAQFFVTLFFSGEAELAVGLKIKLLIIIIWTYAHFINLLFGEAELAVRLQVLIIAGEHAVRLVLTMAFASDDSNHN